MTYTFRNWSYFSVKWMDGSRWWEDRQTWRLNSYLDTLNYIEQFILSNRRFSYLQLHCTELQSRLKEVPITQVLWDFFRVTLASVLFALHCTVGNKFLYVWSNVFLFTINSKKIKYQKISNIIVLFIMTNMNSLWT